MSSIKLPGSPLVKAVHEYVKKELPIETFNHSMRVYYYGTTHLWDLLELQRLIDETGQAILAQAFPTWSTTSFNETYFLTCLLHDIGTTDKNINATLMSLSVPVYLSYGPREY